jgi:phosphatidylinositol alpha-mannosyltransferase
MLLAPPALERVSGRGPDWLRRTVAWLAIEATLARKGLRVFVSARLGAAAAVAQFTAWALQVGACWAVLRALHLEQYAGVLAAAGVLVAVNVTAVVPVTPSNVGVFQAACVAMLAGFGVAGGRGLAYGIVLQAVEVVTAVVLGVPALAGEGLTWDQLRRTAGTLDGDRDRDGEDAG